MIKQPGDVAGLIEGDLHCLVKIEIQPSTMN